MYQHVFLVCSKMHPFGGCLNCRKCSNMLYIQQLVYCSVHQHHVHHLFKKISIVNRVRWVVKVLTRGTKLARFCQNSDCTTMNFSIFQTDIGLRHTKIGHHFRKQNNSNLENHFLAAQIEIQSLKSTLLKYTIILEIKCS